MELHTTYTVNSLAEAGKLSRKWHYWPIRVLGSVRALLYVGVCLVVGARFIYDGLRATPLDSHLAAKGLLIVLGVFVLVAWLASRQSAKLKKQVRAQIPGSLHLELSGITAIDANGATAFEPWSVFSGFRFGKYIVALSRAGKKDFRVIPIDQLDPHRSGSLRSILLSHLPEIS